MATIWRHARRSFVCTGTEYLCSLRVKHPAHESRQEVYVSAVVETRGTPGTIWSVTCLRGASNVSCYAIRPCAPHTQVLTSQSFFPLRGSTQQTCVHMVGTKQCDQPKLDYSSRGFQSWIWRYSSTKLGCCFVVIISKQRVFGVWRVETIVGKAEQKIIDEAFDPCQTRHAKQPEAIPCWVSSQARIILSWKRSYARGVHTQPPGWCVMLPCRLGSNQTHHRRREWITKF